MTRHIPRKRFGQHFLHDTQVIGKIIESLRIDPADCWMEIGPGQGALTQFFPQSMQRLILVEIDRDLAARLEKQFTQSRHIQILNRDILTLDLKQFAVSNKLRIVGNLPYNISTPIFFHLADSAEYINDMTFMVQKEVAERLVAKPGGKTYGRLTLSAASRFTISPLFNVGPGAFTPAPKVNSTVIRLTPHAEQISDNVRQHFDKLVKSAFSQRRKTIKNSLQNHVNVRDLEELNIDPAARAETLNIEQYLKLAQRMI